MLCIHFHLFQENLVFFLDFFLPALISFSQVSCSVSMYFYVIMLLISTFTALQSQKIPDVMSAFKKFIETFCDLS